MVDFVLRHSGLEREEMSKETLPFPLSAFPTVAEISLLLEAGRAQDGEAEGLEATLDEKIQEAGLEAQRSLATSAMNFVYFVKRTSPDTAIHEQNGYAKVHDDKYTFKTNVDNDNCDDVHQQAQAQHACLVFITHVSHPHWLKSSLKSFTFILIPSMMSDSL